MPTDNPLPPAETETPAAVQPEPAGRDLQTILVFSPHPDDDVISMGGTLIRLVEQGHDVLRRRDLRVAVPATGGGEGGGEHRQRVDEHAVVVEHDDLAGQGAASRGRLQARLHDTIPRAATIGPRPGGGEPGRRREP